MGYANFEKFSRKARQVKGKEVIVKDHKKFDEVGLKRKAETQCKREKNNKIMKQWEK